MSELADPPTDITLCPSVSPSGRPCVLHDDERLHAAGHESARDEGGVSACWPTEATDWDRWSAGAFVMPPKPPGVPGVPLAPKRRRWRVSFAWYDLWVGAYVDRKTGVWYFCPLPTLLITWDRQQPTRRAQRGR